MSEAPGIRGKGVTVTAATWMCTVVCLPFILLRLYTRRYLRGGLKTDDYIIIANWLLLVLFTIFVTLSCIHGMGQHVRDLDVDQTSKAMLYILCDQVAASLLVGLGKVAVAVFLLQIVIQKWHKWFLWICIVTVSIICLFTSIIVFTQCTPAESLWNPRLAYKQKCFLNFTTMAFVICSYAAFLDFLLAAFPWIALRRLNMKRKERIVICSSLSLGVLAGICGVFRTAGLGSLYNVQDYVYSLSSTTIWTSAEPSITLICVSLPVLRPLWVKIRKKNKFGPDQTLYSHRESGLGSKHEGGVLTIGSSPYRIHRGPRSLFQDTEVGDIEESLGVVSHNSDETTLIGIPEAARVK